MNTLNGVGNKNADKAATVKAIASIQEKPAKRTLRGRHGFPWVREIDESSWVNWGRERMEA